MVELGRSVGLPDYTLNNMVGASEFLPFVGDALDVQDAGSMIGDAFRDPTLGKIGGAGIMALAAALGVLPVGGDIASTALGKTAKNVAGEAAERAVKDVGVPGVKYLDGGSRAAGEGSSNYVVFDDNLIDILKKYRREGAIYDHPTVAPRDFGVDYPASKFPDGPRADASGKLMETMDGDQIGDGIVVGRRMVGGEDIALPPAQFDPLATATTGRRVETMPAGRMGGAIGRLQQDRLGQPTGIAIADNLSPEKAKMATQHELGHAVDILAPPPNRPLKGGGIPVKGLSDDLEQIYDYGATGEVKRSSQPWTTPGTANYPKPEWRGENMAEAIRLYLANPGYLKQHHPEVAARVRKYVNNHLRLKDIIQFNSLVGAGAAPCRCALPLYHRAENPRVITLTGKEAQPEVAVTLSDAWAQWRDAVMLRNYGKNGSTIIAVKDPEQLRSIFARFDNARRGLPGASSGHRSRPCDLQATGGLRG